MVVLGVKLDPAHDVRDMEWLQSLLPGQILAVYFDDDVYWHERLLLWPRDDASWFVITPDLDIYAEDLSCTGGEGPSKVKLKGKDFKYWSRVGGQSYRFASPVTDNQLLQSYIKQAYQLGLREDDFDADWRPAHVVDCKGTLQPFDEFLPNLVARRIAGKQAHDRRGVGVVTAGGPTSSQRSSHL